MTELLNSVNCPQDLKTMSYEQLSQLAEEIREFVVKHVAVTGGHLAPNLGIVELTLALHRVLESPKDKIVWDVGHQAYIHKIITGRRERFDTLRQFGGISGFPKHCESEHDAFGAGHASTSISAALGIAKARDLAGQDFTVVAVIGDGSLTGGQAYEALNHAGHLGSRLMVVLNDNEMSIAKNVGALSRYLTMLHTAPSYTKLKSDVELLLKRIPAIGPQMAKSVEHLKDSLKHLVVPGVVFKELGFKYIGPVDGHDQRQMEEVFRSVKDKPYPVLIHVITQKGRGYKPAEEKADKFHGVGPFCVESGELIQCAASKSYTSVFGDTIVELAKNDPRIVAISAAMPEGTGLKAFAKQFPNRFFDVGIAEPHAVTFAAGLATQGFRPVVAIYSTFLQRAYDQILHDICLQKLPVIFALDRAGIVGEDGATHQGVFDLAYLRNIPNLTILAPKDENELRHLFKTALTIEGPVAIRYPRGAGVGVQLDGSLKVLPLGAWEKLRNGNQLAILAVGAMVHVAMQAAAELEQCGISCTVVNARSIKPLDGEMIKELCHKIGRVLTIEDHVLTGGFGAAVLEYMERQNICGAKIERMGLPDEFIEHGTRDLLLDKFGLSVAGIVQEAQQFARLKPGPRKELYG